MTNHPFVDAAKLAEWRAWLISRDALIERMRANVREGRGDLYLLQLMTMDVANYRIAMHDPVENIDAALRLASQTLGAIFRQASQNTGDVEVRLGPEPPFRLKATGASGSAHIGNWLKGFFLAAICRDEVSLATLGDIPIGIVRAAPHQGEECSYLFAEALQHFYRRDNETPSLLLNALKATDPQKVDESSSGYVLETLVPQIDCLYRLLSGDDSAFNAALAKGVEWHRRHWTRGKKKEDPNGFFNPGLTAIASLAFDEQIATTIDSPYLPKFLIEGHCVA